MNDYIMLTAILVVGLMICNMFRTVPSREERIQKIQSAIKLNEELFIKHGQQVNIDAIKTLRNQLKVLQNEKSIG